MKPTPHSKRFFLVLHDIRSAENVGSIFRTADAAGVERIYLVGYTPGPIDRFGRANAKVAKAALGAECSVPWERREDVRELLREFKDAGVTTVAVEQSPQATDYYSFALPEKTAFIFGNEVAGISPVLIDCCDAGIEVPMYGSKESLNVSVCVGIVLFAAIGQ
jgi:23S rRNA (guanosine2251-2'-O)-methyltransferase